MLTTRDVYPMKGGDTMDEWLKEFDCNEWSEDERVAAGWNLIAPQSEFSDEYGECSDDCDDY
jgi:hypothetical protein